MDLKDKLYSEAKISPAGKVNKKDITSWLWNLFIFLLGVVSIYTISVIGVLQQSNHIIALSDFIPNQFVQGSMALYVFQGVQNLIIKFRNAKV